ncbi:MAG TPA: hemolysin III family protein [Anaerolineales bacterium]|nr:hemolysin III family protein [Anaerolineales bacterium]
MTSKIKEPFNGFSHLTGAISAFIAGILLLFAAWSGTSRVISMMVYLTSLVSMFTASAVYHLANVKPRIQVILRKLDHAAIFLLIAGTYTPICVNAFTGFWKWGFLSIIWGIALLGIVIKVIYINAPRWLGTSLYLLMGWASIIAFRQLGSLPMNSLIWLIIGGVIYSLGAVVYATRIFNFVPGKFGFHEIWHLFVIGGAVAHFISITSLVTSLG